MRRGVHERFFSGWRARPIGGPSPRKTSIRSLRTTSGRARNRVASGLVSKPPLQLLLVSPEFVFRVEPARPAATPSHRVSDLELASRLSFFLWSSIPDDELLSLASAGRLSDLEILEQQVRRMLADARSQALVNNFVGQWLYLRNVPSLARDPERDPDFDDGLKTAFRRETELFMTHALREDRSVLELLTADYSFVNERLAKHYGIAGCRATDSVESRYPSRGAGCWGTGASSR